jgi:predicted dehydrogenase
MTNLTGGFFNNFLKVIRYTLIYGVSRTFIKIKANYHLQKKFSFNRQRFDNVSTVNENNPEKCVAIIGCGYYPYQVIAYYLSKKNKNFLRCTLDINIDRAISLCISYKGVYATKNLDLILNDPKVKIVYIASNHSSHSEYARLCLLSGKNVHIEKPHVVSFSQLSALTQAISKSDSSVFLGFNRPRSFLFSKIQKELDKEKGPLMINWFVVGHQLESNHWYYDKKEGGRILGNLCHWSDLTLHIVGMKNIFPCKITPASPKDSESDFVAIATFADQSIATITFSAKGKISTGVKEYLNVQKGNCVAFLDNFQTLTIDSGNSIKKISPLFRDHGHKNNILHSYLSTLLNEPGESKQYIISTARFFLGIKEAVEKNKTIILKKI